MASDFLSNILPAQNVPIPPVDQMQSIPSMGPQPTQMPPEAQHVNDVIGQYFQNQQQNQPNSMLQQILANRMQPDLGDAATAGLRETQSYASPEGFRPYSPEEVMAQRTNYQLAPYTTMLENQMKMGTQYMNMSGGGTGVLTNRMMQDNPGMSFTQALNHVQADPRLLGMGIQLQPGTGNQPVISSIPGAPAALGQVKYGENLGGTTGTKQAELGFAGPIAGAAKLAEGQAAAQTAGPIAQATKSGDIAAENLQQGSQTNDIIGLYNNLQKDAQTTPSGAIQSGLASASNIMNMPTKGALAQARFDADLNNLYLATIRSLKGTGRIMEMELDKIGEAAPKATDSNEVKMIKAQTHMAYYTQRMHSLGYDPNTGQPASGQNGIPNPPTPDQINQQMPNQQSGSATHRYDQNSGQLVPLQ